MLVPRKLSAVLNSVLPRPVLALLRRLYAPILHRSVERIDRSLILQVFGDEALSVAQGPFKGMKYVRFSSGSALMPKLLGTYELELHPILKEILSSNYDKIINIGCAEGYYAVGFALNMPNAEVHGFELDPSARDRCRQLAELNGVSTRLRLHGACKPADLQGLVNSKTLIICDCEGAELELLNPSEVKGLIEADILVELHDFIDPQISGVISERFSRTHHVRVVHSAERDPAVYPALRSLGRREQLLALEEFRPGAMEWAFLQTDGAFAS